MKAIKDYWDMICIPQFVWIKRHWLAYIAINTVSIGLIVAITLFQIYPYKFIDFFNKIKLKIKNLFKKG